MATARYGAARATACACATATMAEAGTTLRNRDVGIAALARTSTRGVCR